MNRFPAVPVIAAVMLGGAAGGIARHGIDLALVTPSFPWSTFVINLVGSTLLALLPAIPIVRGSAMLTAALGPGVLGGFTTLSAFSEQTRALLDADRTVTAAAYVALSLTACLLGVLLASRLSTPVERRLADDEGADR